METNDALALVFSRNAFYRRMHFLVLAALLLALIVIGVLLTVFIYLIRSPNRTIYFATDNVSRLIQNVPVSTPNMSTDEVINWTIAAVEKAYSYDYVNYRTQIQNSQKYFTNYGWTKYMEALKASNNLVALTTRKMVAIARVVDQPKIIAQGILGGAYAWKFEIPVLVNYMLPPYDDKNKFANALVVSVIVQRQPALQSYKGLGIVQLIGSMANTTSTAPREISRTGTAG